MGFTLSKGRIPTEKIPDGDSFRKKQKVSFLLPNVERVPIEGIPSYELFRKETGSFFDLIKAYATTS